MIQIDATICGLFGKLLKFADLIDSIDEADSITGMRW